MKKIETTSRPNVGAAQTRSQPGGPGNVHQSHKETFDKLMNKKSGDGKKGRQASSRQSEKRLKQESKLQPEQQVKPRGHTMNIGKPSGRIMHGKHAQHDQAQTMGKDMKKRLGQGENIGEKMLRARGASNKEASAEGDASAMAMTGAANAPTPSPQETAAASAPAATQAAAAEIDQLIDKTVSRILVSSPESGQAQEVRLQLDGKLLGGTEVRLYNMDGQLHVEFLPQTADAGNFLSQQHGHIQETLSKNLKQQKILVGINHDAQKEQGGAKKERRVERKQGTESF